MMRESGFKPLLQIVADASHNTAIAQVVLRLLGCLVAGRIVAKYYLRDNLLKNEALARDYFMSFIMLVCLVWALQIHTAMFDKVFNYRVSLKERLTAPQIFKSISTELHHVRIHSHPRINRSRLHVVQHESDANDVAVAA